MKDEKKNALTPFEREIMKEFGSHYIEQPVAKYVRREEEYDPRAKFFG